MTWHERLFALMPQLELILLAGSYAQRWHLGVQEPMTEMVARWQHQLSAAAKPRRPALPHPSWRNNKWLAANSWFQRDLLPDLRREVRRLLTETHNG